MLKQLSDKLTKVFYQGPELRNMMETLDSFKRLAAKEEQQLKENDGKVNLKDNVMPKNGYIHTLSHILFDDFYNIIV